MARMHENEHFFCGESASFSAIIRGISATVNGRSVSDFDFSKPFDIYEIKTKYKPNVSTHALSTFSLALQKIKVLNADFSFNPTAVPMIQRYMKIFEAYEQQNGIENPFVKG